MRTVLFGGGVEVTGVLGERLKVRRESVGKHRCFQCSALTLSVFKKQNGEQSKGGGGVSSP